MVNTLLVKIGGSLLTDKTKINTPNMGTIKRIAKEVHQARQKKKMMALV